MVKQVETTIKRPEVTESAVVKLLKRAKGAGIRPHILEVGCDDYKQLLGAGKVDYAKLLGMITKHLRGKAELLVKVRAQKPAAAKTPGGRSGAGYLSWVNTAHDSKGRFTSNKGIPSRTMSSHQASNNHPSRYRERS